MRFTTKLGLAIAMVALAAVVVAPMAMAGVINSNHDMTFKFAGNAKAGACSHCHIPHKAGGSKLWQLATTVGTGWQAEPISQLCYSCHGSLSYGGALQQNPFSTFSHGRSVNALTSGALGPSPIGDIASLPSDVLVSSDGSGDLKCTSCHDVHSNNNRPFIRFETLAGTYNFATMCEHCHVNRANAGLKGTNNIRGGAPGYSQHPTEQTIVNTARAAFGAVPGEFNISPGINQPGPVSPANSYNLGGHRQDGAAATNMTCSTCHAVHGNETTVFSTAADGATTVPTTGLTYFNNALGVRNMDPLTVAPYVAPICTGCHMNGALAGVTTNGPGLVGTYSHPIGSLRSTWTLPALPTTAQGNKWGGTGGANEAIICESCHDIHYGTAGTSLLFTTSPAGMENPPASSNRNCPQCHTVFGAMNHHPVQTIAYVGGTTGRTAPVKASQGISNWTTLAYTQSASLYTFQTGTNFIVCKTCHNQDAHNNPGSFNSLPMDAGSEMCMDCHTSNPSIYTSVSNGGPAGNLAGPDSSHYIGTIMTLSYKRIGTWATTGLSSSWGTIAGYGGIICQSCHTFKLGGLLNGGTTSTNTAVVNRVDASHTTLLEHAGNLNTDLAADLCTGCHGNSPTGGTTSATSGGTATHPTISMGYATAATNSIVTKIALSPGTATLAAGNLVNCESCHRPHDAARGSGALILEGCGTGSTKVAGPTPNIFNRSSTNGGVNYTEEATFCNMCHAY